MSFYGNVFNPVARPLIYGNALGWWYDGFGPGPINDVGFGGGFNGFGGGPFNHIDAMTFHGAGPFNAFGAMALREGYPSHPLPPHITTQPDESIGE